MAGKYAKDILPQEVKHHLEQGKKPQIVDVRELDEWASGHIPGAKHIPLGSIHLRHKELDPKQEYVIVCRSGGRSSVACEHLEELGYKVANMPGGMLEWDGEISHD